MSTIKGLGQKYALQEHQLFSWKYLDLPIFIEVLDRLIATLGKKPNELKVLDLGCGSGKLFPSLIERGILESNIYGIDVDEVFLQEAKNDHPDARIFSGDIKNFRAIDGLAEIPFDICISLHVLHFFLTDELQDIFTSVAASLTPIGGFIGLTAHPMRWQTSKRYSYFMPQSRDVLTPWGTRLTIQQHTFADYFQSLNSAGMYVENMWEPTPTEEGRAEPANYYKYSSNPTRLVFLARRYG